MHAPQTQLLQIVPIALSGTNDMVLKWYQKVAFTVFYTQISSPITFKI